MHTETHEKAGQTVTVKLKAPIATGLDAGITTIEAYFVDGWWDQLTGKSWMVSDGNYAAMGYALRSANTLPLDDEVVYGQNIHTGLGHLVHVSEIGASR